MGRYAKEVVSKNPLAILYQPEFRKLQAVIVGIALAAASAGLLPAAVSVWVLLVVGVLTATGVYAVPNAPIFKTTPAVVLDKVKEQDPIAEEAPEPFYNSTSNVG